MTVREIGPRYFYRNNISRNMDAYFWIVIARSQNSYKNSFLFRLLFLFQIANNLSKNGYHSFHFIVYIKSCTKHFSNSQFPSPIQHRSEIISLHGSSNFFLLYYSKIRIVVKGKRLAPEIHRSSNYTFTSNLSKCDHEPLRNNS